MCPRPLLAPAFRHALAAGLALGLSAMVTAADDTELLCLDDPAPRSFAAAAVAPARFHAGGAIYLADFVPLPGTPWWDGHLRAFPSPLPLDEDGQPDVERALWDAGLALESQAPDPAAPASGPITSLAELALGESPWDDDRRRVYTPLALDPDRAPLDRAIFAPLELVPAAPADAERRNDLRELWWRALGADPPELGDRRLAEIFDDFPAVAEAAHAAFRRFYARKRTLLGDPEPASGRPPEACAETGPVRTPCVVDHVLGDIFHGRPAVVDPPANPRYFAGGGDGDVFAGYRDFARLHATRRRVVLAGANDGLLHAFDGGRFHGGRFQGTGLQTGRFDDGTGKELFAVLPRALLPTFGRLAGGDTEHRWGVDGPLVVADVKIDMKPEVATDDPASVQWRTVAIAGLRRGGAAYLALDITQPDPLRREGGDFLPQDPRQIVPGCTRPPGPLDASADLDDGNGQVAGRPELCDAEYPRLLWELSDPELAQTWSTPSVGPVQVEVDGRLETRFVAIFGGGFDPTGSGAGQEIWMVDVADGAILYRRRLEGAVAAGPAAVDTDRDGLLDRIYAGTTGGALYRIDLDGAPALTGSGRVAEPDGKPRKIFDTGGRPIFLRPTVFFVAPLGRWGLAFGTGDRADLQAAAAQGGERFYVFVDDSDHPETPALPLSEELLTAVETVDPRRDLDLLLGPAGRRGWFLVLDEARGEKVVTPATAISGLLSFATFLPDSEPPRNGCRQGSSRRYTLLTRNGDAAGDATGEPGSAEPCARGRCHETAGEAAGEALADVWIEAAPAGASSGAAAAPCDALQGTMAALREQLFPPSCRFANARWDIQARRAGTGVECVVAVPICILRKHWKEF